MITEGAASKKQELSPVELQELMLEYKRTGEIGLRNQLVLHYSYIAQMVAAQTYTLSSNYAQVEDIVNEGILAIIDCIEKYDPEKAQALKPTHTSGYRGQ